MERLVAAFSAHRNPLRPTAFAAMKNRGARHFCRYKRRHT
jgi:hypothetical protein